MTNDFVELDGLSEEEKKVALKILKEFSQKGSSSTYNNILTSDYEEVPVDIETFLKDKRYLGKALIDEEGRFTVFPYWVELLKKIYPDPLGNPMCNTLALTGSIGIGKSFIAVIVCLYELYRTLCLKNPYTHYGIQEIDTITFAFLNITMDAARGVAWDKCQSILQASPWFMSKGTLTQSKEPQWEPPKGIELLYGSQSRHIIGRAVFFCLDGDTIIKTSEGDTRIKDCVGKKVFVDTVDNNGNVVQSDSCTVVPTVRTDEEYQIELDDGTVIKCTANHKFMLKDGSYKEAKDLTESDELFELKQGASELQPDE